MKIIHILLLLVASSCFGQTNIAELRIKDRVLKNARFGAATPADVIVYHDGGIAKVPLADLPAAYQTNFSFSPSGAKDYTETGKKIAALKRESEAVLGQIGAEKKLEETMRQYVDGVFPRNEPLDKIDGNVVHVIDEYHCLFGRNDRYISGYIPRTVAVTNFNGVADEQYFTIKARQVGTFKYKSANGVGNTVPLYDCGSPYVSEKLPDLRERWGRLNKELTALKNPQTTAAK